LDSLTVLAPRNHHRDKAIQTRPAVINGSFFKASRNTYEFSEIIRVPCAPGGANKQDGGGEREPLSPPASNRPVRRRVVVEPVLSFKGEKLVVGLYIPHFGRVFCGRAGEAPGEERRFGSMLTMLRKAAILKFGDFSSY
jgi:hypothetical protein